MSRNMLLFVLCAFLGLGNCSLFPEFLQKHAPVQPSSYASSHTKDCGHVKPAEVHHQPLVGYVLASPVVPAVRTLPQLDLSSNLNKIGQKWLAWKSSLQSLLEAKMQALKPRFRQQHVLLLAPMAVAPLASYPKPARNPSCCCNCAPVYTTPKPYTPKPSCCCCPKPTYTTVKPYTTPKPYSTASPVCCFKVRLPPAKPHYPTAATYYPTQKTYYPPTTAYTTTKPYYPAPKAYEPIKKAGYEAMKPTYATTKYSTAYTTPSTTTPTTTKAPATTHQTTATSKPSTIYITSTHVYATDYTTAKYDKNAPSQTYYGYSEPAKKYADDSHHLEIISNLTMEGLNRTKRGIENSSLDLTDVVRLLETLNLQNVTTRIVCQLACNRSEFGTAGENVYNLVSRIQFPDSGDTPDVGIYSEAAVLGLKLKKTNDCKKCLRFYAGCQ